MNLRLPKKIHQLPVIGDLIAYAGYGSLKLFNFFGPRLLGYKCIKLGTSIIWTPQNKKEIILDGIECLRSRDVEMYLRLTERQKLFFYYSQSESITNLFGFFFGLQERYIKFGAEGVACFIVQSLLISDAVPFINQHRLSERNLVAQKNTARQTMEWMQTHSFDVRLINSYSKVVEKWEQKERFRNLPETSFDNSTSPSAG